jgi:hypothetical protein
MTGLPIFVAGLARCGTSLCMQILHAAPVRCLGEFPAFEPDCVGVNRSTAALLGTGGFAMKIIDPQDSEWPQRFDAKIIWLKRDITQQAKSQVKMLNAFGQPVPGQAWRAIAKTLKADKWPCVEWWNRCATTPLFLSFEELLSDPLTSARRIAEFMEMPGADIQAMRECVLDRNPECRKDMAIETALCQSVEVAQKYGTSNMMAARRILAVHA